MDYHLDIRTLTIVSGVISLILAICMIYTFRRRKTYNGAAQWTLASVISSFALIFMSLRGVAPDFISIIISNTLIVAATGLIAYGLESFAGGTRRAWLFILLTVSLFVSFSYFTYYSPNIKVRIVILFTILTILYAYCAYIIHRTIPRLTNLHNGLLTAVFGMEVIWFILRIVFAVFLEGPIVDFMQSSAFQGVTIIVFLGGNVFIVIGLILLNFQRVEVELLAAMEVAEEATREKIGFIAQVSHDLRAPISSMIGLSNIFRHHSKGFNLPDQFNRFLDQLHASGEFLMILLNNVLDLSAIEMNSASVNPEPIQLNEWCDRIAQLTQPLAAERGVHIQMNAPPPDTRVQTDGTRLSQILLNLLHNAIKFSPEGGTVSVDVSLQRDELLMDVEDQGPGIRPEERERLFEMFAQGPNGRMHQSGKGLGLSIVHRNTQLLDGTIQAEQVAPSGARFIVRIPVTEPCRKECP